MIISPASATESTAPSGHFCPVCLRRVSPAQVDRRSHREACRSGDLDVSLLQCPICGIVLAAEVDLGYWSTVRVQAE